MLSTPEIYLDWSEVPHPDEDATFALKTIARMAYPVAGEMPFILSAPHAKALQDYIGSIKRACAKVTAERNGFLAEIHELKGSSPRAKPIHPIVAAGSW